MMLDAWMQAEIEHKRELRALQRKGVWDTILGAVLMVAFVVLFGILMVAMTPDAKASPSELLSVETVHATVTAYTSSVDETDSTPFETAAGTHTRRGVIACPSRYEFGTHVTIEGNEYVCEDRMNARYSERFDVWVPTKSEAYAFGKKNVEVAIRN